MGGVRVCVGSRFLLVATTTYCKRVVGHTQFVATTCSCQADSCTPLLALPPRPLSPRLPILYSLPLSPFFSHSCALFCAFLHSRKTQLSCFQSIAHSLHKTRGGRGCFLPRTPLSTTHCPLPTLSTVSGAEDFISGGKRCFAMNCESVGMQREDPMAIDIQGMAPLLQVSICLRPLSFTAMCLASRWSPHPRLGESTSIGRCSGTTAWS